MVAADGAFALGEQLRYNPQFINLHLIANGSIPFNFLLDIKHQLKFNKQFQTKFELPNLVKERDHLKRKIDPKNFKLIEHHTEKAKNLHQKNMKMAIDTEVSNRFTEKRCLEMTK